MFGVMTFVLPGNQLHVIGPGSPGDAEHLCARGKQ